LLQPKVEFMEARKQGGRLRITTTELGDAAEILHRMIKDGLKVVEFHREERNLEDAFIDILGRIERGEKDVVLPPPMPQPEAGAKALYNTTPDY
jgi:ABC-2 type transport system ATP-binding protein